jgi:hypothetical protein
MSSPSQGDQPTRPEALKKLAQLQIDRLKKEVGNVLSVTCAEVIGSKGSSTPTCFVRGHMSAYKVGMSAYCTQTNYLYTDSVCCLPARMVNNKLYRSGRVCVEPAHTPASFSVSVYLQNLNC